MVQKKQWKIFNKTRTSIHIFNELNRRKYDKRSGPPLSPWSSCFELLFRLCNTLIIFEMMKIVGAISFLILRLALPCMYNCVCLCVCVLGQRNNFLCKVFDFVLRDHFWVTDVLLILFFLSRCINQSIIADCGATFSLPALTLSFSLFYQHHTDWLTKPTTTAGWIE